MIVTCVTDEETAAYTVKWVRPYPFPIYFINIQSYG